MRVYILGMDGYIGWKLRGYLEEKGHTVAGCDNFSRRERISSLTPVIRDKAIIPLDVMSTTQLAEEFGAFKPDAVVHLAEIPSAPFSMVDANNAIVTQQNNILGSLSVILAMQEACPGAHLLKLGTMGEFAPSSWYHMSKVCDTENIKYACKDFGLACTDVMQGPVYGVGGRFDYDEVWGTVINRWVAMGTVGHPLLVYGTGNQVRAFLPIEDSMKCFEIQLENPPKKGEHRIVLQYAQKWRLLDLAVLIASKMEVSITNIKNPRIEVDKQKTDQSNDWLTDHGYEPAMVEDCIQNLIDAVKPYAGKIETGRFMPKIEWV